jgi:hypothetical protein
MMNNLEINSRYMTAASLSSYSRMLYIHGTYTGALEIEPKNMMKEGKQ